jgi:transposase
MDAPLGNLDCPRCAFLQNGLADALAQMALLQQQVQSLQQQVRGLQQQLKQNSRNSSKPPSSDYFKQKRRRPPSGRKPGGQPGHNGHHRQRLPPGRIDQRVHYIPSSCRFCQSALPQIQRPCDPPPRWHQVCEIPPLAATLTEHQAHGRLCPCCGKITFAAIPDLIRKHVFGARLSGLMNYLSARCHNGKRLIQEILADVFGVPIALGSVAAREREMQAALKRPYAQAQRHLRYAPVKNLDETSWASGGNPCWLWVAATQKAALYRIHRRRSRKVLRRLLGAKQIGTIITDRHGAYSHWPATHRQICWAHLQRDFQYWKDAGIGLGRTGLAICKDLFALWRDVAQGKLSWPNLQQSIQSVQTRLRRTLMWWSEQRHRTPSGFASHLLCCWESLWTFSRQQGVEPTNNHAERMLRPAVLWRKNSFGSQSRGGCIFTERILTTVATLRLQGRNVLEYLCRCIESHRAGQRLPKLILR